MNWFDELDDGAKVVVIGTAAIAGTVILWKGITTAEKISKDISDKKYQAMLPPEYWIAKKTEAEKAAEKAKIEADARIQKNKDRLEYESKMPPEYFKLKEVEETNASKERIAKIEAETKINLAKSEHKLTEKALSEHTWQNIRNVGALTTTANHAINAFANASREVRLHGNN